MPWKVIQYQDPTGKVIVSRMPPNGTAELISGSQLIVQDSQIAAFFHDGKPTDGFRPGRHSLSTQNLPVLSKLLNLATLSRSPFRSYVYFVSMKIFTNLGWGTTTPILFRDDEFRMVNLRANGAFAIRVSDPKVFLRTIVGTQGVETTDSLQEYLRKIIVSRLAQTLAEVLTTILDLTKYYDEIGVRVKNATRESFEQYGVELVDLIIEAITLPAEVQSAINRAAGTRAVGRDEVQHFERVTRSEAIRDAAQQPGGAISAGLAGGLGLGAGMELAREMTKQPPTQDASPASLTLDEIKSKLRELKTLVDEGLITQEDFEQQKQRLLSQF